MTVRHTIDNPNELCEVTELRMGQCAHCLGHVTDEPKDRIPDGITFIAKFTGRCSEDCGEPIEPGDHIQSVAGGNYRHYGCADG